MQAVLVRLTDIATYVVAVLLVCLLIRLFSTVLWKSYLGFTFLIGALVIRNCLLLGRSPFTLSYAKVWSVTSIFVWMCQWYATTEVCSRVFAHYPGIGRYARQILRWCFAIAVVVTTALLTKDWVASAYGRSWFRLVMLLGRGTWWTCAILLLAQAAFFRLHPRPLTLNLALHRRLLVIYSSVIAVASVWTASTNETVAITANLLQNAATAVLYGRWLISFRKSWEFTPWSPQASPEVRQIIAGDAQHALAAVQEAGELSTRFLRGKR